VKTLILDNYDSFTFNLYQYLGELGAELIVRRNDRVSFEEILEIRPERLLISPGPGNPEDPAYFGICRKAILELSTSMPVLGVCLGHQGIFSAFGGRIIRAREVMHGKTSLIRHQGKGILKGLPETMTVMRYHSLIGDPGTLPECLEVTATTDDGIIMGVQHRELPVYGVQFHPESIGTPLGKQLLQNFLELDAWEAAGTGSHAAMSAAS
jgi:anthranilate synthase component 2